MIQKIHVGRRIAGYRRKAGLSQTVLAETLGITPQSVSKWECGTSLPDTELLLRLSHLFGVTINVLLEGEDLLEQITAGEYLTEEIAYFVPREERDYNRAWAEEIVRGRWVERNWKAAHTSPSPVLTEIGREIASVGGVILEIGTGPGGGFMPYVWQADPEASVIVSDLSPTVVLEWKRFLTKSLLAPHFHYAALDFCRIPFRDGTVDVVSDGGGIGNAEGDRGTALREAYRVLKPGGLLVTSTGFVTRETLASLPRNAQTVLLRERPDIFRDLYEETVLAGFSHMDSRITGTWTTEHDDSTIASLARSLGIVLTFTSYVRFCRKA